MPDREFRELVNVPKANRTKNWTSYSITEMMRKNWKIANFLTF